jgi:hypothetical protein
MTTMRLGLLLLTTLFALPAVPASAQDLSSVKNVYFLPMGSGFDQYLANQVSMQGAYQVVTDPQLADAIFTDQIGAKFERQLEELYPPEPEEEEGVEQTGDDSEDPAATADHGDALKEEEEKRPLSSFSRGKGNVFLVDRETRRVVWSIYLRPKDYSSKELNKSAEKLVTALREGTFLK